MEGFPLISISMILPLIGSFMILFAREALSRWIGFLRSMGLIGLN